MEKPFCTYKLLKSDADSFFIGANTEKGFVRSFDFSSHEAEFDRLIILKGGPGTGKSTFMRKAASKYGKDPIFYYCSSDPESLDGVVFKHEGQLYGICDGTAPHVTEMKYPGAVSEIIDLGTYWNKLKIRERHDEIIELTDKKASCFSAAYTYLSSAADVQRALDAITLKVCDREKAANAACRLISKYKIKKGSRKSVYTEAFSMKGCVAYDTFFRKAKQVYFINDSFGIGNVFLKHLDRHLSEEKCEYTAVISPVNTSLLSGIYIESAAVFITHSCFSESDMSGKVINSKRFLTSTSSEYRNRFSFGTKCHNALLSGAAEHLSKACECHFELEKIYIEAMNFKRIDRLHSKLFDTAEK